MAAMMFKWLLLPLFTLSLSATAYEKPHPFYVSVTEVNHNAGEKTLEISIKVFAEDIEQTIEKMAGSALDIHAEKDKAAFDKFLPQYFGRNLAINVDGKPVKLSYVGFETEKESTYCYFQVDGVNTLKKLDLSNSILYDFNDTQINIMHITVGSSRKSLKVSYPEKAASFSF